MPLCSRRVKKVLFLDVDGVLNNGTWASAMHEQEIDVYKEHVLEERAINLLWHICWETGARLIVSSSWRHDQEAYHQLCSQLLKFGMYPLGKLSGPGTDRGSEIRKWLEWNPQITHFAILDDDDDVGPYREHLVQTDPDKGLTETEAYRCMKLLGSSIRLPEEMEDGPLSVGYFENKDPLPSPYQLTEIEWFTSEAEKNVEQAKKEECPLESRQPDCNGKRARPGSTAIYIRTVNTKEGHGDKGPWQLPETIHSDIQISMLTAYAKAHGYKDPVFYLDNGYNGSDTLEPANMVLHREVMAGHIDTVIISALHQVSGGMNILMMMDQTFREHGARLIIASYGKEAREVIRENYDAWVWEGIRAAEESLAEGKGMSPEEMDKELRAELENRRLLYEQDIQNAKPEPHKTTKDGYRLIDANEALWLLKTKYKG